MTPFRWSLGFVLLICVTACSDTAGAPEAGTDTLLKLAAQDYLKREDSPYVITQAEYQGAKDDRWWVFQLSDPYEAAVDAGYDAEDLDRHLYDIPLGMLAAAIDGVDMDVSTYIISFREPCQLVYEIDAADAEALAGDSLSTDDVIDRMEISDLTGCQG